MVLGNGRIIVCLGTLGVLLNPCLNEADVKFPVIYTGNAAFGIVLKDF